MDDKNNRYELIIGFVTLIISFSAFKEELKNVNLDLGFYKFSLADYLLKVVYGFGFCVYLYIIERIARQSKRIKTWRIINIIEKLAFLSFIFIVLSPIILVIAYLSYLAFDRLTHIQKEQKALLSFIIAFVVGIATGMLSGYIMYRYFKSRNNLLIEKIERNQIIELEKANKFYNENYYSQSILEAFKIIELHIIKLLAKQKVLIKRVKLNFNELDNYDEILSNFDELFNYAIDQNLLNKNDINKIKLILKMRNSAAHLNVEQTKTEAKKALDFIKELLEKESDTIKNNR